MEDRPNDFIVSRIVDDAREFARDFVHLRDHCAKDDPRFSAVESEWKKFQDSLSSPDRIVALREFRKVLGEE